MSFQYASWPMPAGVYAGWTTRQTGVSQGAYSSNNIARHVGDIVASVEWNRQLLRTRLIGQPEICWLNQTHSTNVVNTGLADITTAQDGCLTEQKGIGCCVMTADCLPVLFWTQSGSYIAAVHAGWRGLANGILDNALALFPAAERIFCGIGPAISVRAFEVGEDVKQAFQYWPDAQATFIKKDQPGKYWCDLPMLAETQLRAAGVADVYQSGLCSFEQEDLFYSYRRDGQTGRMANLIWKI